MVLNVVPSGGLERWSWEVLGAWRCGLTKGPSIGMRVLGWIGEDQPDGCVARCRSDRSLVAHVLGFPCGQEQLFLDAELTWLIW